MCISLLLTGFRPNDTFKWLEIQPVKEVFFMSLTVQEVIDTILAKAKVSAQPNSTDTLKAGDPATEVTGIITTFIVTPNMIAEAKKLGANLIITHEPTFYQHRDEISWQKGLEAYEEKRRLIDESGIAIWRFHDCMHSARPDLIIEGVIKELGWDNYVVPKSFYEASQNFLKIPRIVIPPRSLSELARELKETLHAGAIRIIGDPDLLCKEVCLYPGAPSVDWQLEILRQPFDVMILGETCEWSLCEYLRDAFELGVKKGCILLGHRNSEEAGMRYLADWIRPLFPHTPITYVPAGDPFRSL